MITELTQLMALPCPACDFHLCQIVDLCVGTYGGVKLLLQ